MKRCTMLSSLIVALLAVTGCQTTGSIGGGLLPAIGGDAPKQAVAVLTSTDGYAAQGIVTFVESGGNVTVTADVWGLPPMSEHAWHVHEFGDIRGADGTATGGHYNPEGHAHGLPEQHKRHAGDLGNLKSDANGRAHKVVVVNNCTIAGRNAILGRGLIVHAKHDDGGQPTGNAGARIAQGVIGVAKP